jgi:hypothetical protein
MALHANGLAALQAGGRFDQLELGGARRALAAYRSASPEDAPELLHEAERAVTRLAGKEAT